MSTDHHALMQIRKKIDPEFKVQNPPQNVLAMSAGYAVYMASSSNLRYQVCMSLWIRFDRSTKRDALTCRKQLCVNLFSIAAHQR